MKTMFKELNETFGERKTIPRQEALSIMYKVFANITLEEVE